MLLGNTWQLLLLHRQLLRNICLLLLHVGMLGATWQLLLLLRELLGDTWQLLLRDNSRLLLLLHVLLLPGWGDRHKLLLQLVKAGLNRLQLPVLLLHTPSLPLLLLVAGCT